MKISNEWAMIKGWRQKLQRSVDEDLAGGAGEEIGPADDFGDLHGGVVDHAREMVTGLVVFAPDEEVAEVGSRSLLMDTNRAVGKLEEFTFGDAKSPVHTAAGSGVGIEAAVAAGSGVNRIFVAGVGCRKGLENILARAVARINTSELAKDFEVFGVE